LKNQGSKYKMARRKFLRSKWRKYSKLGRGRKKLQVYRRPKGIHNKMKQKMKGNPRMVSIGFKKQKKETERITRVTNIQDLSNINKKGKIIIGKVGDHRRLEIINKAKEKGLEIINVNVKKFLKKIEHRKKIKKQKKENKMSKKEKKEEKKKEEKKETEKKIEESKDEEKKNE